MVLQWGPTRNFTAMLEIPKANGLCALLTKYLLSLNPSASWVKVDGVFITVLSTIPSRILEYFWGFQVSRSSSGDPGSARLMKDRLDSANVELGRQLTTSSPRGNAARP